MNMKKIIILLLSLLLCASFLTANEKKIDLNNATLEQIKALPITNQQAMAIYDYRTYLGFFESIYDLTKVREINQKTMNKLKDYVIIRPYTDYSETAQRRDQIHYLLRQLSSNEGSQEGVADLWKNLLITPINVNTATFRELHNIPTVCASDVKAVLKQRRLEDFSDYRNLRNSPGLTHYGATRLNHYISYQPSTTKKLLFNYNFEFANSPFREETEEVLRESFVPDSVSSKFSMWGRYNLDNANPNISHKFRARYESKFNFELDAKLFRKLGETNSINPFAPDDDLSDLLDNNSKYSFTADLTPYDTKIILGNYRVTYGQGLVMQNSDYFNRRGTGYGFNKRVIGIFPDMSSTEEFAFNGVAVEHTNHLFDASFFYSKDKKDAVIWDSNGNDSLDTNDDIFYYILSTPRFSNKELENSEEYFNQYRPYLEEPLPRILMAPRQDYLEEKTMGGHIDVSPLLGTNIGITAYEARYNKHFNVANYDSLADYLLTDPDYYNDKLGMTDTDISSLYSTKTDSYTRDYRRVYGFDWLTTFKNLTLKGEYAELEVDGNPLKLGDDPKAIVATGYLNFENLNFLMLYRNYDLKFDNPYSRAFSEHERFYGSILEKQYYLKNPLVSQIYYNSPWSQPEEGIYIESRYRFNRHLTLTRAYLDIWQRKSDDRLSVRFQGELDYRPIYQISLRLKQKLQTNRAQDDFSRSVSKTSETTFKFRNYLTNRDRLQLEYRHMQVWMAPYTNLTDPAEPGDPNQNAPILPTGNVLNHGNYIAASYIHNFNEYSRIEGSILFWNGHGTSHWDWEDMEIDFMGSEGMKYWFSIYDRISSNLSIFFKYKIKHFKDNSLYLRQYNEPIEGNDYVAQTKHKVSSVRLEVNWNF